MSELIDGQVMYDNIIEINFKNSINLYTSSLVMINSRLNDDVIDRALEKFNVITITESNCKEIVA